MTAHEVMARYLYAATQPTVSYEEAEFSPIGHTQDAFFKANNTAAQLLTALAVQGFRVVKTV